MLQIYMRTSMHGRSPVNLLHIFRKAFPNNTSGRGCSIGIRERIKDIFHILMYIITAKSK